MQKIYPLPLHEWPHATREAWIRSTTPSVDIFDDDGAALRLRPDTRRGYELAAGILFRYQLDQGLMDRAAPIGSGIDRARINGLVAALRALGRKDGTIWNYLMCLHSFMRIIDPVGYHGHIFHLNGISLNEEFQRPPKSFDMHDTGVVLDHVDSFFRRGLDATGRPAHPLIVRDAALVGVLVGHAPRIGNLTAMRLGEELTREGASWLVRFDEHITKGKRPLEYMVSARCQVWLDAYLRDGRPGLACEGESESVWLGLNGRPLTVHQTSHIFRQFCKTYLGKEYSPHVTRKWLSSTAARRSPQAAADAALSLGHSEGVAQRSYREATSLHANRRWGSNLARLRRDAARREAL